MIENRNTILAVILSGLVLIAWQYFYNVPTMEKRQAEQKMQAQVTSPQPGTPSTAPAVGSIAWGECFQARHSLTAYSGEVPMSP